MYIKKTNKNFQTPPCQRRSQHPTPRQHLPISTIKTTIEILRRQLILEVC